MRRISFLSLGPSLALRGKTPSSRSGTALLERIDADRHAVARSARWAEHTAMSTDVSVFTPISRRPIRCTMAKRRSGIFGASGSSDFAHLGDGHGLVGFRTLQIQVFVPVPEWFALPSNTTNRPSHRAGPSHCATSCPMSQSASDPAHGSLQSWLPAETAASATGGINCELSSRMKRGAPFGDSFLVSREATTEDRKSRQLGNCSHNRRKQILDTGGLPRDLRPLSSDLPTMSFKTGQKKNRTVMFLFSRAKGDSSSIWIAPAMANLAF